MDVAQLLEPVVAGGIKDTHFFNGRILTADDLRTMQTAARQHDAQLARAMGDGVAYGLEVSLAQGTAANGTQAVLHIERGLALNLLGDRAALPSAVDVALARSADTQVPDGVFMVCEPPSDGEFTNLGLYLVTIAPASGLEGHAPMTSLSSGGVGTACGSRYEVEGVAFNAIPLTLPSGDASARAQAQALFTTVQSELDTLGSAPLPPDMHKLRNIVAHLFFGSDVESRSATNLLPSSADPSSPGWIHELRTQGVLSDCEVPLALLYWSTRGIEFVDTWAVRRRLTVPLRPSGPLPWILSARNIAKTEAEIRQFQDHLEALRTAHPAPQNVLATDYFRYLPPAGMLPVAGGAAGKAFDYSTFFSGIVFRPPVFIEGARLEPLLRASRQYPAFDFSDPTMVWLYATRENSQAISVGIGTLPQAYLVFATGHTPFAGQAHFDVSRWDYANDSECADEGALA